ncbi:hypothetical protein JCM1840_004524 [Sporobolomyces johnsonii]
MDIAYTQECSIFRGTVSSYYCQSSASMTRYTPVPINCSTLPGNFSLGIHDWRSSYTLSWTAVERPLEIAGGYISLSSNGAVVAAIDVWAGNFPPTSAGELEIPATTICTTFNFGISLDTRTDGQATQALAACSAASVVHRSHNVCFDFPRTSRQLWSNEENLRKISTYYDALLSSDFAEGSTSSQAVSISSSLPSYTYDDSDAEIDELELGCKVKSKRGEEQDQKKEIGGAPFKTVTIVDTAYTTYFAVLVWLATGYISFAPLRSKFGSVDKGAKQARAAELVKMVSEIDSQLPTPASPKSVYRLAHLLELPNLVYLALNNFESQLSPANVADELYSDVSCSYEAIRDVALEYVVDEWKEVRDAEGTREMERRASAGELPKVAIATSMLLARKLMEKYGGV